MQLSLPGDSQLSCLILLSRNSNNNMEQEEISMLITDGLGLLQLAYATSQF